METSQNKLGEIEEKIDALLTERERFRTGTAVLRWVWSGLGGIILAVCSWLLLDHLAVRDQVTQHRVEIADTRSDIDRHESLRGHAGVIVEVSDLKGDLRAIQATLEDIRQSQTRIEESLQRRR